MAFVSYYERNRSAIVAWLWPCSGFSDVPQQALRQSGKVVIDKLRAQVASPSKFNLQKYHKIAVTWKGPKTNLKVELKERKGRERAEEVPRARRPVF